MYLNKHLEGAPKGINQNLRGNRGSVPDNFWSG